MGAKDRPGMGEMVRGGGEVNDTNYDVLVNACRVAVTEMINIGNILNWPIEIPMSYANAINGLKAALEDIDDDEVEE